MKKLLAVVVTLTGITGYPLLKAQPINFHVDHIGSTVSLRLFPNDLLSVFCVSATHNIDSSIKAEILQHSHFSDTHDINTTIAFTAPLRQKTADQDLMLITLDISSLIISAGTYSYSVWRDGQLMEDHEHVDFLDATKTIRADYSNAPTKEFLILWQDNPQHHHYFVYFFDKSGEPCVEEDVTYSGSVKIWGIYKNEQIEHVRQAQATFGKVNNKIIGRFPASDNEKGFAVGAVDTFNSGGASYYVPHSFIALPSDSLLFLMGALADSDFYEYTVTKTNADYLTTNGWKRTTKGDNLIEINGLEPGSYELHVRYDTGPILNYKYTFTIIDPVPWYEKTWFSCLLLVFGGGLLFIAYKRAQRATQKKREEQHKMTRLQLQVYRSQLNPHFIFNALSSIQTLVNKNDAEGANKYLTEFSALLRMTLDQQKAEFWTLQEEVDLLNKYVSLEQLRFRFRYEVAMDENIVPENIPFPSMLLQPIVENAIKHGVSANYENGRLWINFKEQGNNLEINVTDNGKGFDPSLKAKEGHGLFLVQERIVFLNELNKQQQLSLEIRSSVDGTIARFYCKNYLNT